MNKNKKPVIVFMGPQGSGKGTQAEMIKAKFGFSHIEVGGLLRQAAKKHSHFAKVVRESLAKGKLVPTQYAQEVIFEALAKAKNKPLIIDGAPRQLVEARALRKYLAAHGRQLDLIVDITLPAAESLKRLHLRHRSDDTPDAIKRRLKWSREKVKKVLAYFKQTPLEVINGAQSVTAVNKEIVKVLKKHSVV